VYYECSNYDKSKTKIYNQSRLQKKLKDIVPSDEIEMWSKVGGSVRDIMAWKRLVFSPDIALEWVNGGFSLSDTKAWMRMGVETAEEAKRWKYCYYDSRIINHYIAEEIIARGERTPKKCDRYYQH